MAPLTKKRLLAALPFDHLDLRFRSWTRTDLDILAAWPKYPFPYEGFEFSFAGMNSTERDKLFEERDGRVNALPLVIDHADQTAVGYLALVKIDWDEIRVGNFGYRIHPDWVDKGIGTSALRAVCTWAFNCGIASIAVDVAASNTRAVRCYEKVGFMILGEDWREAQDLKKIEISDTQFDFLRPHLRLDGNIPRLRFLEMELKPSFLQH